MNKIKGLAAMLLVSVPLLFGGCAYQHNNRIEVNAIPYVHGQSVQSYDSDRE
jgi:hypothetical protein